MISGFSVAAASCLRQLLKGEVLSDGKPSLLLNRLRNLNNNRCSDDVVKTILLDQLPSHVRAFLAMSNVDDLQALAELAGKVTEAAGPSGSQVSAIAHDAGHNAPSVMATTPNGKLDAIERQVAQLTKQMYQLLDRNQTSNARFPRRRSRSNSRGMNWRQFRQMCEAGICRISSSPWASPIHMTKKKDGE